MPREGGIFVTAYTPSACRELVRTHPPLAMLDRTIMVDTNYLIQVNQKDINSMFFDPNYENTVKSELKKQMARLFRSALKRKLDICFSNFIMREFIGRVPKRRDLLQIYKRYISVVTPKNNYEPCFFDLAAALNSCIIETGQEGDITDTYSYILAVLAGVRYFVTEDQDIKRLNAYLTDMRKKDHEDIAREIRKIKGVFKLLSDLPKDAFPVDDILGFLFRDREQLPVPVSIAKLEEYLPDVLDRTETILWMFQSLQEIAWMRKSVEKLPDEWGEQIVEKVTSRVATIAQLIGLQDIGKIDACSLCAKLVEEGKKWTAESTDQELAFSLSSQLDLLQATIYKQEEEEFGYDSWEEQFYAEEPFKKFFVECENCGEQFELWAEYFGVVNVEPREMGPESCHQWSIETSCPSCKEEVGVMYEYWEYPEFFFNYEDTECEGCKLIPEKIVEPPTTTLSDFFNKDKVSKK